MKKHTADCLIRELRSDRRNITVSFLTGTKKRTQIKIECIDAYIICVYTKGIVGDADLTTKLTTSCLILNQFSQKNCFVINSEKMEHDTGFLLGLSSFAE